MLTPVLLLVVLVNIIGSMNNYNIKNHPLDIRVKRDTETELQNDEPIKLINDTTDNILNSNATVDGTELEEVTDEYEAMTLEDDLLSNYTSHGAEIDEITNKDTAPEKNTIDDILAEVFVSGLNKSEGKFELINNEIRDKVELAEKHTELLEETDNELINSVPEYDINEISEAAGVGKVILIDKIESIYKGEHDQENKNFDAEQEIEIIRELDDKLTNLKNNEDDKTQEELSKYDNDIFDDKHANILLYIIFNLRNDNFNKKETKARQRRYAPYGDRSYNAYPNNINAAGSLEYGPGYNNTAYSAMASNYHPINRQHTQTYPYNMNLNPNNNFNGQFPNYNSNNAHYYNNNYNNQQTNNFRERTNFPTYPTNQNPNRQNYGNYNPNTPYNNQPYYYNNTGYNQRYKPINPFNGNYNESGNNINSNYYPMYNQSVPSDGGQHLATPASGSIGNATLASNSTTSAPIILGTCFMCGSFGCPQFFRKMGFLCVPLNEK